MSKNFINCPMCDSENVIQFEYKINCLDCGKITDINIIELIDEVEEIISNEKREDLKQYVLDAPDLTSFIERLSEIKSRHWICPYCGKKVELKCKICPTCGIFLIRKGVI
ncbi:MAG: hypothetical protein ACFFCE_00205 [Promethearchaeota archaeon]